MELIIGLAVVALIAVFFISQYNRLITLNITVDEAWAQIEVQLKRRADLIPNLVETVKGYAAHEQSTFDRWKFKNERLGVGPRCPWYREPYFSLP